MLVSMTWWDLFGLEEVFLRGWQWEMSLADLLPSQLMEIPWPLELLNMIMAAIQIVDLSVFFSGMALLGLREVPTFMGMQMGTTQVGLSPSLLMGPLLP